MLKKIEDIEDKLIKILGLSEIKKPFCFAQWSKEEPLHVGIYCNESCNEGINKCLYNYLLETLALVREIKNT